MYDAENVEFKFSRLRRHLNKKHFRPEIERGVSHMWDAIVPLLCNIKITSLARYSFDYKYPGDFGGNAHRGTR